MAYLMKRLIAETEGQNQERPHWMRRGSGVCLVADCFLGTLLTLLGDGLPLRGDGLNGSASMFEDVSTQIVALDPNSGWRGGAANAYWTRNLAQSQHATLIANLDRCAAELVSSQAHAVKTLREVLWAGKGIVLVTLMICIGLEMEMPAGQLPSFYLAVLVCGAVLTFAALVLINLAFTTSWNASNLQTASQRLTDMSAALSACSDTIPGPPTWACP
ncbi:ESX-1 secretion-associated protein EspA [Mycobacterium marinum]|uniref:ESX-1 secretion-associated protein EspA n=1 Tax=Mycobacterium marinum TaxID=1781 RepID=A0A3E2N094_MYCMR|nr:EspA/EspE family type VII secretion system effector [Mycobacterium marinum]RFZ45667.1 ESX-1 secretion-associated protein EspA [Mycobacterium marinum]